MKRAFSFAQAVLRDPLAVGAVLPSSPSLARALAAPIRIEPSTIVVELGPGTGAITQALFRLGLPPTQYIGVELSPLLVPQLRSRFPAATFLEGSAEDLVEILRERGIDAASYVVASLPWTLLSPKKQIRVLRAVKSGIDRRGHFVTFTYLPRLCLIPRLRSFHAGIGSRFHFSSLRQFVWANVPPAFVWDCWNE
jgi:phosphatidylethanolamine/phosphatidyl-N-methylethanolamine N-methyltransferase